MTKDEIIERLLSPVIIDLTNNIEYIEELENNLKDRVKEIQKSLGHNKREIKIRNLNFDIMVENKNLFEILRYVRDRLRPNTWELNYSLAKIYFEKYGSLEIKQNFKTLNGIDYDENGYNFGIWLTNQRQMYKKGKLSKERIELLKQIGMRFETRDNDEVWTQMYMLAELYFKEYGNLEIKQNFKTLNGIDYDENGYNLGQWQSCQRQMYKKSKLSKERKDLLEKIGMRFETRDNDEVWNQMYMLVELYFKEYGNLEIPSKFKTLNGTDEDENGYNLGIWLVSQRQMYKKGKLSPERKELLDQIGMIWEIRKRKDKKQELCNEYLIPYEEVENISYNELYAKTMYLLDNNINIIIDDKLNPIYNMSNTNMKVTYGVSLEELIEKYKKKEKEK